MVRYAETKHFTFAVQTVHSPRAETTIFRTVLKSKQVIALFEDICHKLIADCDKQWFYWWLQSKFICNKEELKQYYHAFNILVYHFNHSQFQKKLIDANIWKILVGCLQQLYILLKKHELQSIQQNIGIHKRTKITMLGSVTVMNKISLTQQLNLWLNNDSTNNSMNSSNGVLDLSQLNKKVSSTNEFIDYLIDQPMHFYIFMNIQKNNIKAIPKRTFWNSDYCTNFGKELVELKLKWNEIWSKAGILINNNNESRMDVWIDDQNDLVTN